MSNFTAPLDNLKPLLRDGMDVVFSEQQMSVDPLLCELFQSVFPAAENVDCSVYYPEAAKLEQFGIRSSDDLRRLLSSESQFSSDFYMVFGQNQICLYNSARDDFAAVFSHDEFLTADLVWKWDSQFSQHLATAGIGFGRAGFEYAMRILSALPTERRQRLRPRYRPD